jgi:tellurite methyltransferase
MSMKAKEPFWEDAYRDPSAPSVFGAVSEEIRALLPKLLSASTVLDLGCGDGRNALFLLEHGMTIDAIPISQNTIAKLKAKATVYEDRMRVAVMDARSYVPEHQFDLIIAHGILHLLPRQDWSRLIVHLKDMTKPAGFHIVAVFTDSLPPPDHLALFMSGLFRERELMELYSDWNVELFHSYILEDEQPGGARHRHPVNRFVAQIPWECP